MADKAFGVDQLDILGTGTPTISAPNQLNLDCHTVAISTSVTVGSNLTVNGNIDLGNASSDTISLIGVIDTNIIPSADSSKDIGSNSVRFANGYFDTLYGSGANLTNLPASGISTDPSNIQATWKLGGGSGSGFTFTGPGQDGSEGNPDIYLVRGQRYLFDNTALAGNHPFEFRNAANNADYTDGVSGAQNGLQYINVQHDAPAQLKYRCTIHTNSMLGDIYIIGGPEVISGVLTATTFSGSGASLTSIPAGQLTGTVADARISTLTASKLTGALPAISGANLTSLPAQATIANNADNRVITGGSGVNLNGEANLTFDGAQLTAHMSTANPAVIVGDSNRTSAGQHLAEFRGYWDGNHVARIVYAAGDDTTNKDDGIIKFHTTPSGGGITERLRIGSSGQIGLSGSNYGTAGQVLKSQGSGSAPTWASPSKIRTRNLRAVINFDIGYNPQNSYMQQISPFFAFDTSNYSYSGNPFSDMNNSGGYNNGPYWNRATNEADNYIIANMGNTATAAKVTLCCWYKSDSNNSQGTSNGGDWGPSVWLFGDTRNSVSGGFGINSSKPSFHYTGNSRATATSSPSVTDGNWHHIAYTWDAPNKDLKMYTDGTLYYTNTNLTSVNSNVQFDRIGGGYNYSYTEAPQNMGTVVLYDQIISDAEVTAIYNAGNIFREDL